MKRKFRNPIFITLAALFFMLSVCLIYAQEQAPKVISVSSSGRAKAKPDTAVLLLEIRSTSPLAESALEDNNNKIAAIEAAMKELNLDEKQIKLSGNQFTPAGGGRYISPGQRATGFDVYRTLQIRIPTSTKTQTDLATEIASLLDRLSKAGASILSSDISRISLGGASAVVFTLENPEKFESRACEAAIAKARPIAEEIAKKMGVKITGIHSVQSRITQTMIRMTVMSQFDFPYLSTSPNQIIISANVTANFSFK